MYQYVCLYGQGIILLNYQIQVPKNSLIIIKFKQILVMDQLLILVYKNKA